MCSNEALVGRAIAPWLAEHGRESLFLTSKIWQDAHRPALARCAPNIVLHCILTLPSTFRRECIQMHSNISCFLCANNMRTHAKQSAPAVPAAETMSPPVRHDPLPGSFARQPRGCLEQPVRLLGRWGCPIRSVSRQLLRHSLCVCTDLVCETLAELGMQRLLVMII